MVRLELQEMPAQTMAQLMSVTAMELRRWTNEGRPVNDDGSFPAPEVIAWRLLRAAEIESTSGCRVVNETFAGGKS